jgi:hypothetical protein
MKGLPMRFAYLTSWKTCAASATVPFALAAGINISPILGLVLIAIVITSILLVSPVNQAIAYAKSIHAMIAEKAETPFWLSEVMIHTSFVAMFLGVCATVLSMSGFDFSNIEGRHVLIAALVVVSSIACSICVDLHLPKYSKSTRDLNATKSLFTRRVEVASLAGMFMFGFTAILLLSDCVVNGTRWG